MEKLTEWLIPDNTLDIKGSNSLQQPKSALDRSMLNSPELALANASRECLRMADVINIMLTPVMRLYEKNDKASSDKILDLEQQINKMHSDIKLYVADINEDSLSEPDKRRKIALINFSVNLESAGDVIAKNLLPLADTKNRENLKFSQQGREELIELHKQVITNMHLAINTLVSGNRLQSGSAESIETSNIHLETIRALRQINSLFAAVAYPILSQSGDLLDSRLAKSNSS